MAVQWKTAARVVQQCFNRVSMLPGIRFRGVSRSEATFLYVSICLDGFVFTSLNRLWGRRGLCARAPGMRQ